MQEIKFVENKHLKEKPKDQSKLGFGRIFTDYMFTMEYNSRKAGTMRRFAPTKT